MKRWLTSSPAQARLLTRFARGRRPRLACLAALLCALAGPATAQEVEFTTAAAAVAEAPAGSPVAGSAPPVVVADALGSSVEGQVEAPASGLDEYRHASELERAWFEAGPNLSVRANQTRIRALELGEANVEPAALALIAPGEPPPGLSEVMTSVRLAPGLPIAHMALARAYWDEGERRMAFSEVVQGLWVVPQHLESSLWVVSSLLVMIAAVLIIASAVFIVLVGLSVASDAAHDFGDILSGSLPAFARMALLGCLFLLPVVLGEGLLGLLLVFFVVGFIYGGPRFRTALNLAAVLIVLGTFPVARFATTALHALDSDPVATATLSVIRGVESPSELVLLEATAGEDTLARYALAQHAKRTGNFEQLEQEYQVLLAENASDPMLLTNLGNLHFRAGRTDEAIELYERAVALTDSPILLFDLAQAYARAFRMEEYESAMASAQRLDADVVAELSHSGDTSFVADLPLTVASVRDRLVQRATGPETGLTSEILSIAAPGRLGADWMVFAGSFVVAAMFATLLAGRFDHASSCNRCGRRICGRCDGTVWNNQTCEACHRLFNRPETTDSTLRMARLGALRGREVRIDRIATLSSVLIPGVGGLLAKRPDLSFLGILLFMSAVVCFVWIGGVVPDPLSVGIAGPLFFAMAGGMAMLAYFAVVVTGLFARRRI